MPTYYKFLDENNTDGFSDKPWHIWHMPKRKRPGKWMPFIKELSMYYSGYRVISKSQLAPLIRTTLCEVEIRGDIISEGDIQCVQQARIVRVLDGWNEKTQRLFAIDCAIKSLHVFEDKYPDDDRPRNAIITAQRFAKGEVSEEELRAAYYAACEAGEVAHVEATHAAHASAYTAVADAGRAAEYAADAAYFADAADVRQWQSQQILKYAHRTAKISKKAFHAEPI